MLLYNVTVKINKDVEEEWLQWMRDVHIPEVMNAGMFIESHICRLLYQPEEDDPTYVIQYVCKNRKLLDHYFEKHAPALREEHDKRYKNQFIAFRTVMEVVSPS